MSSNLIGSTKKPSSNSDLVPAGSTGEKASYHIATAGLAAKVRDALGLWLSGFSSENTRRAYRKEIEAFAAFAGRQDAAEAVAHFLTIEDGQAHAVADVWRARKLQGGLSPASINRSMSALNSLVASARRHGLTLLRLEAKGVKSKPYRDTKGPGVRGVQAMLQAAQDGNPEKAARDTAIVRLAYALGLRRGEIESLDIGHIDLQAGTLMVLGKGRAEREPMTLPSNVKSALKAWLAFRGTDCAAAPLFTSLDNHSRGARLSGSGIYHIIATQLGAKAGVKARPHGLRHTAITEALHVLKGDVRRVRSFSRHASVQTLVAYDDARSDFAGEIAQALDSVLGC